MTTSLKNRGVVSVLAIVGIVIVGWTLGMLMDGALQKKKSAVPPKTTESAPSTLVEPQNAPVKSDAVKPRA